MCQNWGHWNQGSETCAKAEVWEKKGDDRAASITSIWGIKEYQPQDNKNQPPAAFDYGGEPARMQLDASITFLKVTS